LVQIQRAGENGFACSVSQRFANENLVPQCRAARGSLGLDSANTVHVIGLNHRSAGLEIRSRAALDPQGALAFQRELIAAGTRQCAVVSTCNRTEVYFVGDTQETVKRMLAADAGMDEEELTGYLYRKSGICAVCHLFQVASGLDSAVLGETEIVAQVKQAWNLASSGGTSGPTLDLVFKRALKTSKRIRTETDLCRNAVSVGTLAVREAEALAGKLTKRRILVLGSGQIAERIAKELHAHKAKNVVFLNRSAERAVALASRFGFESGPLSNIEAELLAADVVFATTSAPHPIVTEADLARLQGDRDGRPLIAVDLGVPQNIEPDIRMAGVTIVTMETLVALGMENQERRSSAIPDALAILYDELEKVRNKLVERNAAGTIKRLTEHGDDVKDKTLAWALSKLPDLTEKERRVVEDMARRIVLGVLTPALEELKTGSLSGDERQTVERLFVRSLEGSLQDAA
jgi:glutamyl-tRNA reductase